ncbi:MAG: class I SAM-dependent methyltransferase [Rhodomicrobium sp.]
MQESLQEQRKPARCPDAAVSFHDGVAEAWDAKYNSGRFLKRAQFFEALIMPEIRAPGRWLDAGCGSGYFSRLLAAGGLTVTGADASLPMVEAARQLAATAGLSHTLQFEAVQTVERLPYADASFDGCVCLSVIEYLEKPEACLAELARVIAPGGMLVLSVPHRWAPVRVVQPLVFSTLRTLAPGRWEYSVLSRNAVTKSELARILAKRGFALQRTLDFYHTVPEALQRLIPPSLIFAIAVRQKIPSSAGH